MNNVNFIDPMGTFKVRVDLGDDTYMDDTGVHKKQAVEPFVVAYDQYREYLMDLNEYTNVDNNVTISLTIAQARMVAEVGNAMFDFIPILGDFKGILESIKGKDTLGNQLSIIDRALGILCMAELRKLKNLDKVAELADIVKDVEKIVDNNKVNKFVNIAEDMLRANPETYYKYSELRDLIKSKGLSGKSQGFEAHHLLEKRFANKLGVNQDDILSVALTPQWHRNVRNGGANIDHEIVSEIIKMGTTPSNASIAQIWKAHKKVYSKMGQSDWVKALYEAYFKNKGVDF
jgi:hypothetical protein